MFAQDIVSFSIKNNFAIKFDANDRGHYAALKFILKGKNVSMPYFETLYKPFYLKISKLENEEIKIETFYKMDNTLYYNIDYLSECSINEFLENFPSEHLRYNK